jgi:hypothetical protein
MVPSIARVAEPEHVKLVVRLADDPDSLTEHHWASEESVWGHPLGDDLFEIRNVPWETEGLHFLDVVSCRPRDDGRWDVLELVRPSGHTTIRLTFDQTASDELREGVLAQLEGLVGRVERIQGEHWAVDVNPGAEISDALNALAAAQQQGVVARSSHT